MGYRFGARASFAICLSLALTACGGGGGGGNSGSAQVSDAGAVTPSTQTSPTNSLSVNPGQFNLLALNNSGVDQVQNLTLTGQYSGDGVLVGFAPGTAIPSWLSFPQTINDSTGSSFSVPVVLNATSLADGDYSTMLRLVTGSIQDQVVTGIVDVPFNLLVEEAPQVFQGSVTLLTTVGQAASASQSVTLDFGGATASSVNVTLSSTQGDPTQWLVASFNGSTQTLTVQPKPGLAVGNYTATASLAYTLQGAQGLKSIPISMVVGPDGPIVYQVSPGYMFLQQSNVLVLRGYAFTRASSIGVSIGGLAASAVSVVNATEIRATFDTSPPAGVYNVQVSFDGAATSVGAVSVVPKPVYTQQNVTIPCSSPVEDVLSDPLRNHLIAICDDTYYLVSQVGSTWQITAQRNLDSLGPATYRSPALLTMDQKYIVTTAQSELVLIDPASLQTVAVLPLPPLQAPGGVNDAVPNCVAALNSGKLLLALASAHSGMVGNYYVYDLNNHTLDPTGQPAANAMFTNWQGVATNASVASLAYRTYSEPPMVSSDTGLFAVTNIASPPSLQISAISSDAQKFLNVSGSDFLIYQSSTSGMLATITDGGSMGTSLVFSQDATQLYVIDCLGGTLKVFNATPGNTNLVASSSFAPLYSLVSYPTPDGGAFVLYDPSPPIDTPQVLPITILPIPQP